MCALISQSACVSITITPADCGMQDMTGDIVMHDEEKSGIYQLQNMIPLEMRMTVN